MHLLALDPRPLDPRPSIPQFFSKALILASWSLSCASCLRSVSWDDSMRIRSFSTASMRPLNFSDVAMNSDRLTNCVESRMNTMEAAAGRALSKKSPYLSRESMRQKAKGERLKAKAEGVMQLERLKA